MNQRSEEVPAVHCAWLCLRPRHCHFRERRGICECNLWRNFKHGATKLVEHKLTRNPLDEGSAYITLFIKCIYDFEKRIACIFRATRCIQGVAQTLLNRDVEIIKFPSGYLSDSVSGLDTVQSTH